MCLIPRRGSIFCALFLVFQGVEFASDLTVLRAEGIFKITNF